MAFTPIAKLVDLHDGCKITARVGRYSLLLTQVDGRRFIFEDRCPHMDAVLNDGAIEGGIITCRAHGIGFDIQTGKAEGPLADTLDCLTFFTPVYEGQWIGVDV